MPKGKKFNAAEQHFLGKEVKYKQQISALKIEFEKQKITIESLVCMYEKLEAKCHEQDDQISQLLKYTELSKDDIKKACEKDKATADAMKIFTGISKTTGAKFF